MSDYKRLSPEIEITCFRVVQEALTNIKTFQGKNASVKFEFGMRFISIIIKDDGIGFDKENIGQGYGLMGMRERIEILNGKFEISSFKNNGTQIYISIPVRVLRMIRLLVADDHALIRKGLVQLIEMEKDIKLSLRLRMGKRLINLQRNLCLI